MRVLLTGASGFIGRPALDLLLTRGHEVLCLSRQSNDEESKNLAKNLRWHQCDLSLSSSWELAVREFKPEACLHLAWEGIPDYGFERSFKNLQLGANLVHFLTSIGCGHIVISGSCWEYGSVSGSVSEETAPVEPGVFASSKLALQQLASALCRTNGATLAWGRVFYPYGLGQKNASLVPSICLAIAAGMRPVLKTPGSANDFLYVDDAAAALVFLLEKKVVGTYNIGSGTAQSVGTVADTLLQFARRAPLFLPVVPGAAFWADTTRLRTLGWEPKISFEEGLRRTFESFVSPRAV